MRWSEATRNDHVYLQTNQFGRKVRQALRFLIGKSVLDGNVLSFNPSKLAELLRKRVYENRATGRSGSLQVTDAEDFSRLLRRGLD
jgi:hypothetical protein